MHAAHTARRQFGVFLILLLCAAGWCAEITINPAKTYQTIDGWGNGSGNLGQPFVNIYQLLGPEIADPVNYAIIDYLADDLGLTGTRIWEIGARTDGQGLDAGDCDVIDWTRFHPGTYADVDGKYLKHFQDRVIAGGATPSFYSSTIYSTYSTYFKPWVINHPGERAQQIWANALYWRDHFGINLNYAVISNEPGFGGNPYTGAIIADDIKALGPRLAAHGLKTKVQFPEGVDPASAWTMMIPLLFDPEAWSYVGRLSYHHYGTDDPFRSNMRDFGSLRGIPTGQTEMDPASIGQLFADLDLGGVTYWEMAFSGTNTLACNPGQTTFTPSRFYFPIRQVTHYVRPGAMRIEALSSDSGVRALAFLRDKRVTIVIMAFGRSDQAVTITGLPAGAYGVSQSRINDATPFKELGVRRAGADGSVTVTGLGTATVTTVYPLSGNNQPPTISTWTATPGRVTPPAQSSMLAVVASDPELDPLQYAWTIVKQPAGAAATLATPNAATTAVNGLTTAGAYVFNIDVKDGVNTTAKRLYLLVGDNQPPLLGHTGFRFGAVYGMALDVPGKTPLTAIVALPTPPVMLSANVWDLENDPLTAEWSVVSQPPGANVTLSQTKFIYASFRATVTGATVAGDYTFNIDVHDAVHTTSTRVTLTVTPENTPPAIIAATAKPDTLTTPGDAATLAVTAKDAENELLRCWWTVKAVPMGAKPLFDHQGLATTTVSNLKLPGRYLFTARVFDDIHMVTADVAVTVNPAAGAPVVTSAPAVSVLAGTPFTYTVEASNAPTALRADGLPPGVTFANGVIAGTPRVVGRWHIQLSAVNAVGTAYGNLALTVQFPAPVISSPLTADGKVGAQFRYITAASNCPMKYTATGLPAGITINPQTGIITGTPTAAGIFKVTLTAANAGGEDTKTLVLSIGEAGAH